MARALPRCDPVSDHGTNTQQRSSISPSCQQQLAMTTASDEATPRFPLIWDATQIRYFDWEERCNMSLNVSGKGVYLDGLCGEAVSASHRLERPFPLRPAVTAADYWPEGDGPLQDGAALPLLTGELSTDGGRNPIVYDVAEYWSLQKASRCALQAGSGGGRHTRLSQQCGVTEAGLSNILGKVRDVSVHKVPMAAQQLRAAMPLVQFLTRKPAFRGWDTSHNWLYGGGCVAVMDRSQKLLHTCGRDVAVAELTPCEDTPSSPLTLRAEDEALLTWPQDQTVLQIEAADKEFEAVAVRSVSAARFYLQRGRRLTSVDTLESTVPLSAVCCQPELPSRWAAINTSGRLTVRNCVTGTTEVRVQLPEVERRLGWFGLDPGEDQHSFRAASWERLYTVDVRLREPRVLFRLSASSRLYSAGDRLHAVRGSALLPHLTLLTSSRHLLVMDARQPAVPWLRSRLTVPQAPLYLSGTASGHPSSHTELVTVASQADHHVQALVYDWAAGVELGASRLLGCARPPLEAAGPPGVEAARRLALPLAGVAAHRPAAGLLHLYTANSCGDVFVHPLLAADTEGTLAGDERHERTGQEDGTETERKRKHAERDAAERAATDKEKRSRAETERQSDAVGRRRRRRCRRLVAAWSSAVEEQRRQMARSTDLRCDGVARWDGDLRELLNSPPSERDEECCDPGVPWCPPGAGDTPRSEANRASRTPRRWESRTGGTPRSWEEDRADGTPRSGVDQVDRTPRSGVDQVDRTPRSGVDQADWTPRRPESSERLESEVELSPSDSPAGDASSTDVSTPPHSEIEDLLMQWEMDDAGGSESEGALSVAEELTASALSIPGSRRRRLVPRWQRRRRSSASSCASSRPASRASSCASSRPDSRASSRSPSHSRASDGESSAGGSSVSGAGPASSLITPARPLPPVSQGAAFQQFSLDLFDD